VFSVRLTRVPDSGAPLKENRRLELSEVGLKEPFEAEGVEASWELSRMFGKSYGKIRASARVRLTCGRCLEEFSAPVSTEFSVLFEPRSASGGRSSQSQDSEADDDVDKDEAGDTTVFFDGEDLPLGEEIRQELELAVPFRALCRRDCKGLCHRCGTNLNQGACGCPPERGGGPFAALKDRPTRS
jgi:uncharacterized protein